MSTNSNAKQQTIYIVLGIVIALLLGAVIYLAVQNSKNSKKAKGLETELTEVEMLKEDLQKEYDLALDELEALKGENAEMDNIITQQQEELEAQKQKIERLIAAGADLKKARREIDNLKAQAQEYLAELEQLRAENAELSQQNTRLSADLDSQLVENEELLTVKAELVSQKQVLEKERLRLSEKVNRASVIEAREIMVTGQMLKDNGKVKEKDKAKKVDRFKICWRASENPVVEEGVEKFYVRIIDPRGETIAVENMGSGVMTLTETQEQVRYTTMEEVSYKPAGANACSYWKQDGGFGEGKYTIEVYNKGFLSGRTSIELK